MEAHTDHVPACVRFVQNGGQSLHISVKNHDTQSEKVKGFDSTW